MNPRLDDVQERLEAALARIDEALVLPTPDENIAEKFYEIFKDGLGPREVEFMFG